MLPSAELEVALDHPREAVAHEAQVHEARSHRDLLGSEGVAVLLGLQLLGLVEQRGPLFFALLVVYWLLFNLCRRRRRCLIQLALRDCVHRLGVDRGRVLDWFEHQGWPWRAAGELVAKLRLLGRVVKGLDGLERSLVGFGAVPASLTR